jgi:hypothetical protein
VTRGTDAGRLLYYLYGPGKANVLWDLQGRSVMLQLLTASLLRNFSLGV